MGLKNRTRSQRPDPTRSMDAESVSTYRKRLLDAIDVDEVAKLGRDAQRARLERVVTKLVSGDGPLLSSTERSALVRRVVDEAVGLGVLEPLLADPEVTEIMVNGHRNVFVERAGRIERADVGFSDEAQLRQTIDRIVASVDRRIDASSPMVDARLATGERVNAVIAPLALDGASLTIRRFPKPFTADELVARGALDQPTIDLLRGCVKARCNIVVSGGTGTGKTTLLNVVSGFIGRDERIVTIEDSAELSLAQEHVVRLEARPANVEGHGRIAIRDLVRNALRMRPDRIVVGEVRGGEALDMLQAMNTGHEGSLTTVHANTADDALARLLTLASMSELELPYEALREQVAGAIHIIVQLARSDDGSRRISEIAAVMRQPNEAPTLLPLVRRGDAMLQAPLEHFAPPPWLQDRFAAAGLLASRASR